MLFWYFLKTRFYAAYGQWVQVLILIIQVLKLLVQVFQTDESCDWPFESLDYPPSFVKDPTSVSEGKELCSSYSPGGEFPPVGTGVDVTDSRFPAVSSWTGGITFSPTHRACVTGSLKIILDFWWFLVFYQGGSQKETSQFTASGSTSSLQNCGNTL